MVCAEDVITDLMTAWLELTSDSIVAEKTFMIFVWPTTGDLFLLILIHISSLPLTVEQPTINICMLTDDVHCISWQWEKRWHCVPDTTLDASKICSSLWNSPTWACVGIIYLVSNVTYTCPTLQVLHPHPVSERASLPSEHDEAYRWWWWWWWCLQ